MRDGRTNEQGKIGLLSQWKLEAEFRNCYDLRWMLYCYPISHAMISNHMRTKVSIHLIESPQREIWLEGWLGSSWQIWQCHIMAASILTALHSTGKADIWQWRIITQGTELHKKHHKLRQYTSCSQVPCTRWIFAMFLLHCAKIHSNAMQEILHNWVQSTKCTALQY